MTKSEIIERIDELVEDLTEKQYNDFIAYLKSFVTTEEPH